VLSCATTQATRGRLATNLATSVGAPMKAEALGTRRQLENAMTPVLMILQGHAGVIVA